ncbi:MAG: FAD-dependent oxidoreductase, partial [Stackebrandtia sp.]
MNLPTETEVLIVGAGPVGLTLAAALARDGVDATLVDRAAEGANTSRAAVVHARTLEVLSELDVTGELVSRGVIVPSFNVRDRDRVLLSVGFDKLPTPFPYTLMVPQNITEEVLLNRLRAIGGEVHRPHEVTGITTEDGRATAGFADGRRIRARYVIGCDGMHSTIREHSGIGFTGDSYAESFVLADVHMDWSEPDDRVLLFFDPSGVMVVAPLPEGRHRIVATLEPAPEHPGVDDIQSLLDTRGPVR